MTLYLIGLGMGKNSISLDAFETLKTCDKIYLENYTVNFPYSIKKLESQYDIKIEELDRTKVENESIIKKAKNKDVSLLVYGDALSATTHIQLILECKKQKVHYQIFHNASILTTVAETGLSLYKFGKTVSMPDWTEHKNRPTSFMSYVKDNLSILSHTLILTDIGLKIKNAITELEESSEKTDTSLPEKIIAISHAGTENQKIFYDSLDALRNKKISMPFCLIIPTELHFLEEESLEALKE